MQIITGFHAIEELLRSVEAQLEKKNSATKSSATKETDTEKTIRRKRLAAERLLPTEKLLSVVRLLATEGLLPVERQPDCGLRSFTPSRGRA